MEMEGILINLAYVIGLVVLLNEISLFLVSGWFADDGLLEAIEGLGKQKKSINKYNRRILQVGERNDMYVSHFGVIPGILAFYHVHVDRNGGYSKRIPIWSSTHWKIRRFYYEARLTERYRSGKM